QRKSRTHAELEYTRARFDVQRLDDPFDARKEDALKDLVVEVRELRVDLATVRIGRSAVALNAHGPPFVRLPRAEWPAPFAPEPSTPLDRSLLWSGGRSASKLPLERHDVPLPEPPLPPLLECGQQMLPRELVDGIEADVEYLRHLFAVQVDVVPVKHRVRALRWIGLALHTTHAKNRSRRSTPHAPRRT